MALADEIRDLADRVLRDLRASHDFYEHTKASWRMTQEFGHAGHPLDIQDTETGAILKACAEITFAVSPAAQGSVHKQHYSLTLFPSFPSVQRFSCPVQTRLEQKATKATKSESRSQNGGETSPGVSGIVSTTAGGFRQVADHGKRPSPSHLLDRASGMPFPRRDQLSEQVSFVKVICALALSVREELI
jgi:hypothetical protein